MIVQQLGIEGFEVKPNECGWDAMQYGMRTHLVKIFADAYADLK